MEEERITYNPMYQNCPYMMQGMYMNPMYPQQMQQLTGYESMMYPQQMQQTPGYPSMMGQTDQSMGYPMGRDDEEEEFSDEEDYRYRRPYHHYYPHHMYHHYHPYHPYYPYNHGYYHHR